MIRKRSERHKGRLLRLVAVVAAVMLVAGACGDDEPDTSAADAAAAAEAERAAAAEAEAAAAEAERAAAQAEADAAQAAAEEAQAAADEAAARLAEAEAAAAEASAEQQAEAQAALEAAQAEAAEAAAAAEAAQAEAEAARAEADAAAAEAAAAQEPAAAPDPATIRYFSMWREGESQQLVLQGMIDSFEAATGHTVDVQWAGRDVLTTVRAAVSAGDSVDLVDLDGEAGIGAIVKTGQAVSLADVLDMTIPGEDATVADVIPSEFLDVYAIDGEPHMIPYEVISSGIHYNGARLAELGLDPPATWDDFIAVSLASGDNSVQHDGLVNFYNAYWLYWLMVRHGGPGTFHAAASDPTGEGWRSGPIQAAVADLVKLVDSGALADGYEGSNWPISQQSWAAGDGTFNINGTWLADETSSYTPSGFEYRMLSFPTVDGGHESAELYQIGWAVPTASAEPDVAKQFIAYAVQRDRLAGIALVAKNLTPRADIGVPPDIQDAADIFAANPQVHRPYDGVPGDYPEYWSTVFLPLDDQLFFGQISGQEFIDRIAADTAEFWANQ